MHLDELLERRGVSVTRFAEEVGITRANMSHIKTGDIKAIRFTTLEQICKVLNCQPGDLLEYIPDQE